VSEARDFLNLDSSADDSLLAIFIAAARQHFEGVTGRTTTPRNLAARFDVFPDNQGSMILPRVPVSAVSAVKYLNTSGVETTLSSTEYRVDTASVPARVGLAHGKSWPDTAIMESAVTIEYSSGFASAELVPAVDRNIILMLVADMYEHRNAQSELNLTNDSKFDRVLAARQIPEVH